MKSWLYLALVALPLGGCVLPPAVSIASLAFDVGSFAATGKSATDHVISGIAGEDCRMLGVFEGEICREEQEFEAAVASLEPLRPLPSEPAMDLEPQTAPIQLAAAEPDSDVSPLTGLDYISAGLSRPAASAAALPTPRPAPEPAMEREAAKPEVHQVAALMPVAEGQAQQSATRGLVYGDDGGVLGVAYAFQNPLAGMDGNRESLNRRVSLIDR